MKFRTIGNALMMCALIAGCTQRTAPQPHTAGVQSASAAEKKVDFMVIPIEGGEGTPDSPLGIDFELVEVKSHSGPRKTQD